MRLRPRRGVLGLRGRIVGAVLVTTVATLGVAALALLGPLENSLRTAALTTLGHDVRQSGAIAGFRSLHLSALPTTRADPAFETAGQAELAALGARQTELAERLAVSTRNVELLGYPDRSTGQGQPLIRTHDDLAGQPDSYDDVAQAFLTNRPVHSFGSLDDTPVARLAIPIKIDGLRYVLAVRKPIDGIPSAVHAVRTAFLTAALVGLVLTLLLAIPLADRIVRRLRHLRQAALRLANEGPDVEVPEDRARDEVGDLARTFALMQRQLQDQERARRAFVATASHELRTPLASLDGMLELLDDDLQSGDPDLEDARSLLERARAQSRRLGRLAADLLDLSRIDADVHLRSEPVELGELSRAVLAEFELGTTERGISSTLDDSIGPVWALGDPGSVARIVRILVDNAVRVSPHGAEIMVELHNGPRAALSVSDRGPGVPTEERELIFERFKRGRETHGQAGFGLGLAIGRELASRMGGELVLENLDPPGATFTLRLPVAQAPDEEPVTAS